MEKDMTHDFDDPIAALATPWGQSALAIIRTSGNSVIELIGKVFSGKNELIHSKDNQTIVGTLIDSVNGEKIDEVVLAVYREPRSYTGQDSVEIMCHGSPPGIVRILQLLWNQGFREAGPGEFTQRAFLNGKMDLTRAEAVNEIITAKTEKAQSLALIRLTGGVEKRIKNAKKILVDILGTIEIQLDYSEEDIEDLPVPFEKIEKVKTLLKGLADSYQTGLLYQQGIRVALVGRTNAGKSSLFNLLLKEDRAIVSQHHGTTRDYLEELITIEGIPIRLFDTAGLRKSKHPIESEGIKRSESIISNADIILYMIDAVVGMQPEDERQIQSLKQKTEHIIVWNKIDQKDAKAQPPNCISISSITGEGLKELEKAISNIASTEKTSTNENVVIDSLRQKTLMTQALEGIIRFEDAIKRNTPFDMAVLDLQDAVRALGEITGEVSTSDVLEQMFSQFCVGK